MPVHPRERGEHCSIIQAPACVTGSSPRARGTQLHPGRRDRQRRFIPASAGNTCATRPGLHGASVHPRERGEHDRRLRRQGPHRRFIPASAGNTTRARAQIMRSAVHPRERGEHSCTQAGEIGNDGSSPRARGTLACLSARWAQRRFIPASAGNTPCESERTESHAVHPRERGEHVAIRLSAVSRPRFIPASAGNTASALANSCARPVHPRERGEHQGEPMQEDAQSGSSPRARGTLGRQ